MRKILALVAVLGLGAYAADRAATPTQLQQRLNGSPLTLGNVASFDAGISVNNWTTGTSFDAGFGDLLRYTCNGAVYSKAGLASTLATTSDTPVQAYTPTTTLLLESQNAIAVLSQDAGIAACHYDHLR